MENKSEADHQLKFPFVWYTAQDKVASILQSYGHEVTALDMAASGVNPTRMEELVSLEDHVRRLKEYLERLHSDERVRLVGHSLGGGDISIAMEKFPEKISVACWPWPKLALERLVIPWIQRLPLREKIILNLSAGESISWHPRYISFVRSSLRDVTKLSDEKYGTVRRVFVVCQEDMMLKEDFQRWMIEKNPPDKVKVIEGAGHMAMMSKPCELSRLLLDTASNS